ncbi:MAG: hypothetical protein K0S68_319 [Candidatus Saccharibacteria bacterium]|jgi:hypothetical protein|nr:hypothetical protein [Candidatus Saccharibacteria bacterium]
MRSRLSRLLSRRLAFVAVFAAVAIFAVLALRQGNTASAAQAIVGQCRDQKLQDECYAEQFGAITKRSGLKASLATLDEFQKLPGAQRGCHFIAHHIAAAAVTASGDWRRTISELPLEDCSGGFLMGLMEERQRLEPGLKYTPASIQETCSAMPEDQQAKTCFHTMGHLVLVQTRGVVDDSLVICRELPEPASRYECLSGTFMENLYRRNLQAHKVGKELQWTPERAQALTALCQAQTGEAAKACWRELSHVFVVHEKSRPEAVFAKCQTALTDETRAACYLHAVGVMTLMQSNSQDADKLCEPYATSADRLKECQSMIRRNHGH